MARTTRPTANAGRGFYEKIREGDAAITTGAFVSPSLSLRRDVASHYEGTVNFCR